MECLAVIPARGGSKGVPRKNILPLSGKPLIAHSILQARQAQHVNRIVVSTDDQEIASIAQYYRAEVVWRPPEISGDNASSESALLHVLEFLAQSEGYQPELLAFLQCTSPLTLAEDIDGTIQALLDSGADTALAAIPFHYFVWKTDAQGNAVGINHDKRVRPLRQEREPQFLETGAVYVMRAAEFQHAKHRFFGHTALYVMPAERRLEIDDPVDFQVAEVLIGAQKQAEQARRLPPNTAALVLDFDGVFTDNKVYVLDDGREAVLCDRSDGWGIAHLKRAGVPILVLSSETNPVVQARADKLGISCLHGHQVKEEILAAWLEEHNLDPAQVIYVGNDVNDLGCMALVGCSVAVANAHPSVLSRADLVLEHNGGDGALREICELILHTIEQ